jgi:hypothetical protein
MSWIMPLVLYFAALLIVLALLRFSRWRRDRQGQRPPFLDLLLRSPGHGLDKEIQDMNDDISAYLALCGVSPLIFNVIYLGAFRADPATIWIPLVFWIVGCGVTLWFILKTYNLVNQRRSLRTGMAGELATGEELNRLMLDGYHVYHDFPGDRFNIDHIVVGPQGVFAVETKARSKKGKGKGDAVVVYDGEQLRYPTWVTKAPMQQAKALSAWLSKWMSKAVGSRVMVEPIVALPGWYVERKSGKGVPVINPKEARRFFAGGKERLLDESMITRICHQLEQKCRDVDMWEWY